MLTTRRWRGDALGTRCPNCNQLFCDGDVIRDEVPVRHLNCPSHTEEIVYGPYTRVADGRGISPCERCGNEIKVGERYEILGHGSGFRHAEVTCTPTPTPPAVHKYTATITYTAPRELYPMSRVRIENAIQKGAKPVDAVASEVNRLHEEEESARHSWYIRSETVYAQEYFGNFADEQAAYKALADLAYTHKGRRWEVHTGHKPK